MNPEILVLDEPAAGLDPRGRESIFGNIMEYHRETGSTVVIVSHSMEDMARFCDDIIVMSGSKVKMQGSCSEIFSRTEELEEVNLNIPEISQVCRMLREQGIAIPNGIFTVEDAVSAIAHLLKAKLPQEREGGTAQ